MPTENRSSNTEMVSVPRHMLERATDNKHLEKERISIHRHEALFALRGLLAQPAPQPHPEPIAWMVGTAFWWTKEEAERDAAATGLPIVGLGPMTCSNEVELLREVIKHSDAQIMRQSIRISNQRAQLAEAHALLREAACHATRMEPMSASCLNRIDTALDRKD
ncbi:hypothetical protein ACL6MW_28840 [Pseudomonas putida]|uniref:hypothetical protein n=1 Tax=Pseudomonas putida TaxID=303 RepID=UPI001E54BEC9|nr:hypothetical protein [Pseudomonas putida]